MLRVVFLSLHGDWRRNGDVEENLEDLVDEVDVLRGGNRMKSRGNLKKSTQTSTENRFIPLLTFSIIRSSVSTR
jgi:hypothetical protein